MLQILQFLVEALKGFKLKTCIAMCHSRGFKVLRESRVENKVNPYERYDTRDLIFC